MTVVASEGFDRTVPHSGQNRAVSGTAARQAGQVTVGSYAVAVRQGSRPTAMLPQASSAAAYDI
jgi:hypothetical protein